MEIVLKDACSVPMEIMENATKSFVEFAKGSTLAKMPVYGILQKTGCQPERIHQYQIHEKQRIRRETECFGKIYQD